MVSWFRRRPATVEVAGSTDQEPKQRARPSTAPCSKKGCTGASRVACDYRDRRGKACPTVWCPDHIVAIGSWHFCRRHARLSQALRPVGFRGELPAPDLDNRSPSLAAYLGEALDPLVRRLLDEIIRPENGESIGEDPLALVVPRTGSRRWARGWKLYDNTGPLLRIGVEVEEDKDPECAVRLNGRVILRCVPPWIEARRSGVKAGATADGLPRADFYNTLVEQYLRPAVVAEERWVRRWERTPQAGAGAGTWS